MNNFSPYWRFLISFLVASILFCIVWLSSQFKNPPTFNALAIVWFLNIFITFEVIGFVQNKLYTTNQNIQIKLKALLVISVGIITGTIVYAIQFYGFKWLDYWLYGSEIPKLTHLKLSVLMGLFMATIFSLAHFLLKMRKEYYNTLIENQRYKNEVLQNNLSILKNQLDPHFIFNNFNALYYLIDSDSELAKRFLKNISSIYRYLIENNEKQAIPAIEEYKIAIQYLEIIKERFQSSIQITDQVTDILLEDRFLPPLVIQQLLENAIKHNRVDSDSPLYITLSNTASSFTVSNSVHKKDLYESTGTGLSNLKKRYSYLSTNTVDIIVNTSNFSVTIPILDNES